MDVSRVTRHELEEYADKLMNIGFPLGDYATILLKKDERVIACFLNNGEPRIVDITGSAYALKSALIGLDSYKAAIVSRPTYTGKCIEAGEPLPAVLDDMAQIVGPEVPIVYGDRFELRKALKSCAAVMTTSGELITCGRSLYEAYTCLTVTEKNAEIYAKAAVLGGANPMNKALAKGEHLFYLKKYSKAENDKQQGTQPKEVPGGALSKLGSKVATKVGETIVKSANDGRIGAIIDKLDERGEDSKIARAANRFGTKLGRPDTYEDSFGQSAIEAPAYLQERFDQVEAEFQRESAKFDTPDEQLAQFREQFNPFKLSESDLEAAQVLVDYGKKLVATGLVQGTWGNISIKLDDTYMLCTPSGLDYESLTPEQMVKVDFHTHEYESELKPTSEKGLHAGIYRSRADVGAIVHTHSKYASIFAACDTTMETSDGAEVRCASYGLAGTEVLAQNTFRALGKNRGCFMSHHGMVAVGATIEEAFKNCALIELTAKEYINSNYEG